MGLEGLRICNHYLLASMSRVCCFGALKVSAWGSFVDVPVLAPPEPYSCPPVRRWPGCVFARIPAVTRSVI